MNIPGSNLIGAPGTASYILAATASDRTSVADVAVSYGANADANAVSPGLLDALKDSLRVAG